MNVQSRASIISCNANGIEICASAARISTTQGNEDEIFQQAKGNSKNLGLIEKVLRSGHKSVIEHAVFTISFRDVSAFVEQYLIESRLASFTVKSRRYVDFSQSGYYIPPALEGDALAVYRRYMDLLFSAYRELLDAGVPKEDARFVLPYAFRSNFYCTLNARELAHILTSIRRGRGRAIPELNDLADQLVSQVERVFPALLPELEAVPAEDSAAGADWPFRLEAAPCYVEARNAGGVKLLGGPADPLAILRAAHQAAGSGEPFQVDKLLASPRPRELEQLPYSFLISDVTLSGVTHLVRHRMQSIIIPPIQGVDHSRYIVPDSVRERPEAWELYRSALERANAMLQNVARDPALRPYGCYFALSGNLMDVMTTANARELRHFIQLRACNRAQWEVRSIAVSVLKLLRENCGELFSRFGPSCCLLGYCPEGKLTCGKMDEVRARFGADRQTGETRTE